MDLAKLHLHWRPRRYGNKEYRSYSLARPYRQNGKNRREIVLSLGPLTQDEIKHWQTLLKAFKDPDSFLTTRRDIKVNKHLQYLDCAIVNEVWKYWQLDDVFTSTSEKKDIPTATIARILTINRALNPVCKSKVPEWFKKTALSWLFEVEPDKINSSRIFRELTAIERLKESLCDHIFNLIRSKEPDSLKSVFYDLSSSTFSGSRCILSKWGHCKEGFKTHVVLALVVDKNGYPFYWEVLAGNTADATTISGLVEKLYKKFKIANSTMVFDRGMVSDENLRLLEKEGIKYISALDRNQIESTSKFDFTSLCDLKIKEKENLLLRKHNFTTLNASTYFKEIKTEGKRRYILCFNPQLFKDQQDACLKSIKDFKEFVRRQNQELAKAIKSRNLAPTKKRFDKEKQRMKLNDIVEVTLNEIPIIHQDSKGPPQKVMTYEAAVTVNEQERRCRGQIDGFWMLVTNHIEREKAIFEISPEDVIKPYRDKHIIEAAFRDIKSFVEIAPIHVWTNEHVNAHYTICVLAYLINRTLTRRLHEDPGKQTTDIITHETLYEAVDDCKVDEILVKNIGLKFCSITELNHLQKELLTRVGMSFLTTNPEVEKIVV